MRVWKSNIGGLVALSLLLSLGACKTWEPAGTTPEALVAEARPPSVRVTTTYGTQVTLKNPFLVNDSIVSAVAVAAPSGSVVRPPRTGIPERDVNLLEVPRFSAGRTLALAGAIVGASITWARIQRSAGGNEPRPTPLPKDSAALDLIGIVSLLRGIF